MMGSEKKTVKRQEHAIIANSGDSGAAGEKDRSSIPTPLMSTNGVENYPDMAFYFLSTLDRP